MSLTSDEVNILVYRYLEESGFAHTAFSFVAESQITKSPTAKVNLPPGALLAFLQKGLQYTEIEAHMKDDGTVLPFESEFSLLTPYLPKGGLAPAKAPASSAKRKLAGAAARNKKNGNRRTPEGEPLFDPSVSETAVLPLTGHRGPVYHCLWNPLRNLIASGSEDATVRIWNLKTLGENVRLARHLGGQVSSSAVSLDHRPSNQSPADGGLAKSSNASVTVVDWSPDGSRLATGCNDGPIRIWELQADGVSMKFALGLPRKAGPVLALRWSPDGALIAAGSDAEGGVTVWDAVSGAVVQQYTTHKRMVSDLSWMSLDETGRATDVAAAAAARRSRYRLATCSAESVIYVFGVTSPKPLRALTGHKGEVNSLQWSPYGARLLSASDDRTARVWTLGGLLDEDGIADSTENDDTVVIFEGHRKEVYSARWSPQKQVRPKKSQPDASCSSEAEAGAESAADFLVATASFDHAIKLWDSSTGECIRTLTRHSSCVYSVSFSPNGRYLASGSYDSELLVWDVATGTVLLSYVHSSAAANGTQGIFDVRWNDAGDKVAACFVDSTICVLDFDGHSAKTEKSSAEESSGGGSAAPETDEQTVKRLRN
eukprot:INCI20202.3.p1 GENE.INCI20202.3~~INCI20202.3.p1  ORF type:complete len:600 (-),score=83.54 INCI20202.3:898-2697(-)